jgi:hypothetical protein
VLGAHKSSKIPYPFESTVTRDPLPSPRHAQNSSMNVFMDAHGRMRDEPHRCTRDAIAHQSPVGLGGTALSLGYIRGEMANPLEL